MKTIVLSLCFVLLFAAVSFALSVNDNAPPIALRDSNNDFFYLSDYVNSPQPPLKVRGGKGELEGKKGRVGENCKGVIVNFFSSTCKPCKKELPVLNSLVDEFEKQGIKVVIVGHKEGFDKFMAMLEDLKVNKPIILSDPYGKTGTKYGVYGLPVTVFIGSDAKVKYIIKGESSEMEKTLRERAGKLIKGK